MYYVGNSPLRAAADPVDGRFVTLRGEEFYCISNYSALRPFLMSVVSPEDHWMFISSSGGLTAGRGSPEQALFPYYTEDKLHDSAEVTGSKTLLWVQRRGQSSFWEPFSERFAGLYAVRRNLYKNLWGNKIVFEEVNDDLGVTFRYSWSNSARFGFVRSASLSNHGRAAVRVRLLDGIQNLLPSGMGSRFQLEKSNLLDAYKKNERVDGTTLALFRLSSIPIDRPEPAEALRTTAAWCLGLPPGKMLLCSRQLHEFRAGRPLRLETDIRGERGGYFVETTFRLSPGGAREWLLAADVNQGPSQVAGLRRWLTPTRRRSWQPRFDAVLKDVDSGSLELKRLVAGADGLQKSAQPLSDARHFHNVLFNIMRGGTFSDGMLIDVADLRRFIAGANRPLAKKSGRFFRALAAAARPARRAHGGRADALSHSALIDLAARSGEPQLERLCREYLPLTFSRRHGDPSRPWNRFNIAPRNPEGSRRLDYEGNWRDIFQNWEALAVSFPAYTAGMVCRFVNASTAEGYNPYRLTRDGIDWEVPDPADPWSHIGYWGDHQVIYLLKLLESLQRHEPEVLRQFLTREIFCYANVPYRIKPYGSLLNHPKETVTFDAVAEEVVRRRVRECGADGKLVWNPQGRVRLVNLAEKLLVLVLSKFANFIPGVGIWMNTQRPEWNDANNALVGNGVSVVTLAYLRRFLSFCEAQFRALDEPEIELSEEVAVFFHAVARILRAQRAGLSLLANHSETPAVSAWRRRVLDALGSAGGRYRARLYDRGFSSRTVTLSGAALLAFHHDALQFADASLRANRRPDGLFHAYNLAAFDQPRRLPVRRLYEMLEGQVAALSSGTLSAAESLGVLRALRRSPLYCDAQAAYLLYPDRRLPRFVEKNILPPRLLARSRLLRRLLHEGNRDLVERDVDGVVHFAGAVTNARDVEQILDRLAGTGLRSLVQAERDLVLNLFEQVFDHASFTGRSGTFFGYEGLGCVYWHMVSKLLLAIQEVYFRATGEGAPPPVVRRLKHGYYEVRRGLGDARSPAQYGAFPMDPYSHTPGQGGARQPGLSGQVKEDILCRFGELGVCVEAGHLCFRPSLLCHASFLRKPATFRSFDVDGRELSLALPAGALAFTYCQTQVVYRAGVQSRVTIWFADGSRREVPGLTLEPEVSHEIFQRSGTVGRVLVEIPAEALR